VLHGTVGPQELVHTPCGWAFAERTMRGSDVIGFRWIYLSVAEKDTYERLNEWLRAVKKSSEAMQTALDHLILKEGS